MIRAASKRYFNAYRGLPRSVWLLALVLFVNRCGMMVLPFLSLYLTEELDYTEAAAGRMISVFGIGAIFGTYLGGRAAHRFGAIRVQTVCMIVSVPLYLIVPIWSTWLEIAASLVVLAIFSEAVRPANATAIAQETTPETRPRAFALQRLAANLGFSIGPALGGHIAELNYALLFVVDAVTTLFAGLALWHFFRGQTKPVLEDATKSEAYDKSPLTNGRFVAFLVLKTATLVVFMQFIFTYPFYLRDHYGMDESQIGYLFAVNTVTIVLFEMILVDYAQRWSLVRMIGVGSFLCCIGFGILPFGSTTSFAVGAMLIVTVGEMISFPNAVAYVARLGPAGNEARYLGWYTVTHSVARVIAPTLWGTIYGMNRETVWYAGLAVGVIVLVGFRLLERCGPEES